MRVVVVSVLALGACAALLYVLGREGGGAAAVTEARPEMRADAAPAPAPGLRGAPPAPPVAASPPVPPRQLTELQRIVDEDQKRNAARNAALVAAGMLSADEADTELLEGLLERRMSGELTERAYRSACAVVHARRVQRREAGFRAGHLDERELREARLDLAAAQAEASGETDAYARAWREHLAWREQQTRALVEAGRLNEAQARGALEKDLMRWPWPPGLADNAAQELAPYLTPRWGWVSAVERDGDRVVRVHIVFGGAPTLNPLRMLRLWRGEVQVGQVHVEAIQLDGREMDAEVVSLESDCQPRVGDVINGM